jgi:carboxypeptidase Q
MSTATNHVFALESDSGVFAPASLGFTGSAAARVMIQQIATLLTPLGMSEIGAGGGGADIGPIAAAGNVPTMAYMGDAERLFLIHHTAADTIERIAPEEVRRAAAAIAVITYAVAEMPDRLPR